MAGTSGTGGEPAAGTGADGGDGDFSIIPASSGAGGGGGAGGQGGQGGSGLGRDGGGGSGGAGGTSDSPAGQSAEPVSGPSSMGGGGGGGGAHGASGISLPTISAIGGAGGAGANATALSGSASAGGGGGGGFGAIVASDSDLGILRVSLTGGAGGNGGNAVAPTGAGGSGGAGGAGLYVASTAYPAMLIISTVQGGAGGAGGTGSTTNGIGGAGGAGIFGETDGMLFFTLSGSAQALGGDGGASAGTAGAGGIGIAGSNLFVTLEAGTTVSGGLSGDGLTRADAIRFTGGANILMLKGNGGTSGQTYATLTGAVTGVLGGTDLLRLSGQGGVFDLAQLGVGFRNFPAVSVEGERAVWVATGASGASANWQVTGQGILQLGNSDASATLAGTVTVEYGTLTTDPTGSHGASVTGDVAIGEMGSLIAHEVSGLSALTSGGALSFDPLATFSARFGAATLTTPLVSVAGNVTLGGVMSVSGSGATTAGSYRLIAYGTTASGAFSAIYGSSDFSYVVGDDTLNHVVTLTVSDITSYWNGTTTTPTTPASVVGGDGIWTAASAVHNWTDAGGTSAQAWSTGRTAVFSGTAGTVVVDTTDGPISANALKFVTSGYTVTGNAPGDHIILEGVSSRPQVNVVGADTLATLAVALIGTQGFEKTGAGTLVLTGQSSFAGQAIVSAGTLSIENGGTLTAQGARVGGDADILATGAAALTVKGTGSSLNLGADDLTIVGYGATALTIADGATVTSGQTQVSGQGGASSTVTVTGSGTSWTASSIYVGQWGAGTFTISGGATVTSGEGTITSGVVGSGSTAIVTGVGSHWNLGSDSLIIGGYGTNTLTVENGGTLTSADSIIFGGLPGDPGSASVTVTGSGSSWTVGMLLVGYYDHAALTISSGGTVNSGIGMVGSIYYPSAGFTDLTSTATVTGPGSVWNLIGSPLVIGGYQNGFLTISDGGLVMSTVGAVGFGPASGTVTVTGTGSQWDLGQSTLILGFQGQATVTIADGGMVSAAQVAKGPAFAGATLIFNGGVLKATGDTSDFLSGFAPGDIILQAGGATLDTDAYTVQVSSVLTGPGALTKQGSGTLVLTGANTYAGGTTVAAGTLQIGDGGTMGAISGNVSLAQGASLAFNLSSPTTFSGVLSGAGALVQAGSGTLTLTGANSYTGGTLIAAGATLQIGDGGTTGAIQGDVLNNGTLLVNRSGSFTLAGNITGSGAVVFSGGGVLRVAAPSAGSVAIDGASVELLAGTSGTSPITVNAGGFLGGSARIGALTMNSGATVSPGYSPGTLTVSGAVAFNAGSVYRVDVTPLAAHDLIVAGGAVTLSNGAQVQVAATPGLYAPTTRYAILTTSDTLTGTFGSVTSDYAFLTPTLSYDAQTVYLTLAYTGATFASFATTVNQAGVAVAAQALGLGNPVFDALLVLPSGAVAPALNTLTGEIYASAQTVMQQQSIYVREAVGTRLRQAVPPSSGAALAYAAKAAGPQTARLGADLTPTLWAQGYGGWGNSFSDGNAATISNSIGGFLIGADVEVASQVRAGVFGGFSQSQVQVNDRASSGNMDNYDLGLYAGAQFGALAARAGAAYTWHDVSAKRTPAFPGYVSATSAGYTTGTAQVFGELGYDMAVGAYGFEPFAGLAYVNVGSATFTEGGGSAALAGETASMDTFTTTLGVRAATTLELQGRALTPSVTVGWQHAFADVTPSSSMRFVSGQTPFTVYGTPIAQDAAVLAAGLSYALSERATVAANYTGQIASTSTQNAITAQFSLRF